MRFKEILHCYKAPYLVGRQWLFIFFIVTGYNIRIFLNDKELISGYLIDFGKQLNFYLWFPETLTNDDVKLILQNRIQLVCVSKLFFCSRNVQSRPAYISTLTTECLTTLTSQFGKKYYQEPQQLFLQVPDKFPIFKSHLNTTDLYLIDCTKI